MKSDELLKDIVTIVLFLALFFIMSVTEEQNISAMPPLDVTANECQ